MTLHRRPSCLGCNRPCRADEGYRTNVKFVNVCPTCLEPRRHQWMRKVEKAERIAAVERVQAAA